MNSSFLIHGETRTPILCTPLDEFCPVNVDKNISWVLISWIQYNILNVIERFSAVALLWADAGRLGICLTGK